MGVYGQSAFYPGAVGARFAPMTETARMRRINGGGSARYLLYLYSPTRPEVVTDGVMPMVKGAQYMTSAGDEPGALLGVSSNMIKGPCEYMVYSFDVEFEGKNVCRMGDQLWHNTKSICG